MPFLTSRQRGLVMLVVALVAAAGVTALTGLDRWSLVIIAVLLGIVCVVLIDIRHRQQVGARAQHRLEEAIEALDSSIEALGASVTAELRDLRARAEDLRGDLADLGATIRSEVDTAAERHAQTSGRLSRLDYEPVNEMQALLQLLPKVPDAPPLPEVGGWALSAGTLLELWDLIEVNRPATVVECGSGSSTLWMARALQGVGNGRVIALEHDARYAAQTRKLLDRHGLSQFAEVRHARLRDAVVDNKRVSWYDTDCISDVDQIDLLVVDGPPKWTGEMARYPAVPLLREKLSRGAWIVMDDAYRPDEKEAVTQWSAAYGVTAERRLSRDAALLRSP